MKPTIKEQILELKNQGLSYREIQAKLGCSKGTIAYHIGIGQKDKTQNRTKEYRTRVKRFIQEYKSGKRCADCGEDYPYWLLEFDHTGNNKSFNISEFSQHSTALEKIKEEIDKCDVVCCNCHRNRTFMRQTNDARHVGLEFCNYPE